VALLTSALVAGLAALFAWRALAAGFRPIDAIAAQVRGIDADALHARIRASDAPCEVAPVAQHLNDLLDRLAATFERERRFAGNLAHELRTPIAELRTLADVARKWPDDRAAVLAYFGDVKDIADRMHVVVGDLLLLARCQAGVEECAQAPVRIRSVLASAWSHHAPAAARRALTWQCDAPESLVLHTDAGKLAIILHNLVGNAVSHALHGSVVRCTVVPAGPGATLTISNRAARLPADDMARLTEPFWRKATGSDDVHVGLGLPLVVALTELLGLRVTLRQEDDGTFHAQVTGLLVAREVDGAARSQASTRDRAAS
jgi:signal transduction histidine kinase